MVRTSAARARQFWSIHSIDVECQVYQSSYTRTLLCIVSFTPIRQRNDEIFPSWLQTSPPPSGTYTMQRSIRGTHKGLLHAHTCIYIYILGNPGTCLSSGITRNRIRPCYGRQNKQNGRQGRNCFYSIKGGEQETARRVPGTGSIPAGLSK